MDVLNAKTISIQLMEPLVLLKPPLLIVMITIGTYLLVFLVKENSLQQMQVYVFQKLRIVF